MAMKQQLDFFESIELQTKRDNGNKQLVEYGICSENSDYRVHVGYKVQHIYVFPTESGKRVLEKYGDERFASVDGKTITAKGHAVPTSIINGMQSILIPHDIYKQNFISQDMITTTKGQFAVRIVVEMLKKKLIPLPIDINITDDKALQISGTDIIIHSKLKLQVKCDYKAGKKEYGGTGNVFLQTHECNPYELH